MKKRAKVHLLPTDKGCLVQYGKNVNYLPYQNTPDYIKQQNRRRFDLYITTDDEIKEDDWFMFYGEPRQAKNLIAEPVNQGKIIATTDSELYYTQQNGHLGQAIIQVPQIPQSFIEEYCKNLIDKVYVEYEPVCCKSYTSCNSNCSIKEWNLKLTSNNEVIIHPIEEKMYTREEVEQLCRKAYEDGFYEGGLKDSPCKDPIFWIKENL